jgi:hypothetical protein
VRFSAALIVIPALLAMGAARADVTISSSATANMTCSGGVCAPTAKNAVLNVGDLQSLLASGSAMVTTTGAGIQANNIDIDTALSWSSNNTLSLDAYQSILVENPVSIMGLSGLSLTTDNGGNNGYLAFRDKGQVIFANLSSALTINGAAYTLVTDIVTLASDIAANSAGNYALANDFDASKDGTYQNSPIPTEFSGSFEGLGNTISNLSLNGTGDVNDPVGLFAELALNNEPGGSIDNVNLQKLSVSGSGIQIGGLVGVNEGTVSGVTVSGHFDVTGSPSVGGVVDFNLGTITRSSAVATITADAESAAGGLVDENAGTILQSFARCTLIAGDMAYLGGLVDQNVGPITESYAEGDIKGGTNSDVGG